MEKSKIQLIQSQSIAISLLDTNDGQIAGVPANPRTIDPVDFANLKKSIEDNPEMLGMRELLVYPVGGRYVVIGGNMRLKAMRDLGFSDAPCKVLPESTDTATLRAVLIKDNVQKGEWDAAMLQNDWSADELQEWGVELPEFEQPEPEQPKAEEDDFDEDADAIEKRVQAGDIWQLGDHRLMCGDSTDAGAVALLMDGEKADLVFTDPPYGMKKENEGVLNDNLNYDDLLAFNKLWIPISFDNLKDNGSWYCWGTDEPLMDIYSEILKPMARACKITFRNLLSWNKGDAGAGGVSFMGKDGLRSYPIGSEKCLFVMAGVEGFNNNADNYFDGWEKIRAYLAGEAEKVGLDAKKLQEICGVGMFSHWFTKSQFTFITEEHYKELQNHYKGEAFGRDYGAFKRDYEEIKRDYEEIKRVFRQHARQYDRRLGFSKGKR